MKIVLVGAGGSGISNLAYILDELWYTNLLAIDGYESQITQALREKGIPLIIGHGKYELKPDDIVIYSEAVVESPEVQTAFRLKLEHQQPLKIWNYFQFLGEMSKYFRTVGFSWTNGKSSSTALAITTAKQLLPELGIGIVGALIPDFNNKSYYLKSEKKSEFRQLFDAIFTGRKIPYDLIKKRYFFLEACEYKRHFLNLDLEHLLITNIELDHTDYYHDVEDYVSAFQQMIQKTKAQTFVLENLALPALAKTDQLIQVPINQYRLQHIWWRHTDQNASLVEALLLHLAPGLTPQEIHDAMYPFKGIWRRMELLTRLENWALLYTDYGHIASSLKLGYALLKEKYPDKKIIAIFQPHQMHRVLTGWEDFYEALSCFDQRAIYAIYAAREKIEDFAHEPRFQQYQISTVEELGRCFANEHHASYLEDFDALKHYLEQRRDDEIVVVFTAGDLDFQLRKYLYKL